MAKYSKVLPLFVAGNEATIEASIAEGGALHDNKGIIYGYAKDSGRYCYINIDKQIHWIVGNNESNVKRVSSLPTEAELNTLYILNNTVYLWDEELNAYVATYHDVTEQIVALNDAVSTLSNTVSELVEDVASKPSRDEINTALTNAIGESKEYTDNAIIPLNESISGLSDNVSQIRSDLTSSVSTLQNNIDTSVAEIRSDMSTMQEQIDAIGESSQQTEEQVIIVQEQAKEYTDQQTQQVIQYVNDTFELKEV